MLELPVEKQLPELLPRSPVPLLLNIELGGNVAAR
jgi:hypothetical protein